MQNVNPAHQTLHLIALLIQNIELCARKESAIPSFGIWMQSVFDDSNLLNENVHNTIIPEIPPWTLQLPRKFFLGFCINQGLI